MSILRALTVNPGLVLRHRNVFLLSHMRANTSLFGHLLGSHPQIEGYYEMHIGYYSWKSLWRQKLRHFATHQPKPTAQFMFDKVLHDGHAVATQLLRRPGSRTVMMLREPLQSIRSLVMLYTKDSPHLPEAQAEGAARYYIDRLNSLADIAEAMPGQFFYLDAECLVSSTDTTLEALGRWLGLASPIPTEYQTFAQTGKGKAGDTSSRLKSGKISRSVNQYEDVQLPADLADEARATYDRVRAVLIARSQAKITMPAEAVHALQTA